MAVRRRCGGVYYDALCGVVDGKIRCFVLKWSVMERCRKMVWGGGRLKWLRVC